MTSPRIIFWGTPEFVLPVLKSVLEKGWDVISVVTKPDEFVGRKQILTSPPVKIFAQKHKIPVLQPENLKDEIFIKELPEADLFIVAGYGKIIPKRILEMPKFEALVLHPSLLPRWRGPSPIQFAILNGDKETGVTIIKMDELMDHGPIIVQRVVCKIDRKSYRELNEKLWSEATALLVKTLPKYLKREITFQPQNDTLATYSKILKKDDGRINWKKPAEDIERMVRALNPWPGTWTLWPFDQKIYRVKIEKSHAITDEPGVGSSGYIWQKSSYPMLIKTGKGSLAIEMLTLEGKKNINAISFLHGHPKFLGTTLI